eukprot:Gb_14173 [translate_table: standard]
MGQRLSESRLRFERVEKCSVLDREKQTIVADLDGTLLRSKSPFPYFMLVAFEAGSPSRALILLLSWPLVWLLYSVLLWESMAIQIMIFVTFVGLKESDVITVARAVLPKFYLEDLHSVAYGVFLSCWRRFVVTETPTVMVEYFVKQFLGVEKVVGTELHVTAFGVFTGFVRGGGVVDKCNAVKTLLGDDENIVADIGLGDSPSDYQFLGLCKEAYMVTSGTKAEKVPRERYLMPLVFHDGRLVMRPTPLVSLATFMWMPVGFVLATFRIAIGLTLPMEYALPLEALLGVRVRVRGAPPLIMSAKSKEQEGILFICTHRTLLDPIFLSTALRRKVTAVTYSISRVSEVLTPIKTVRLRRCRSEDSKIVRNLLERKEDLVICPEGTTCREPYLLRFSPLFAELGETIVPVAVNVEMRMFHGNTARGWKSLDPLFFFMNPRPSYEVIFLDPLPHHMSCAAGKSGIEVANYIQKQLAQTLGFQCTSLTRKDKYMVLAGNDGRA